MEKKIGVAARQAAAMEQLSEEISQLREELDYKRSRPLIKLDKQVVLTLFLLIETAFKIFVIYKII